jgi:GNAT superfamily N-acetyltransferase
MAVDYSVREKLSPDALAALLSESWEAPPSSDWPVVLDRSLTWITAHEAGALIGFVYVVWDGGAHTFLLDPTVHPSARRRGIGTTLVRLATEEARSTGAEWLHVDYEPHLAKFYEGCGFRRTDAGLISLREGGPGTG